MKMRSPWLSLCFVVLAATSCEFSPVFKTCPAMDGSEDDGATCYCAALVKPSPRICLASPPTELYTLETSPFGTGDLTPPCMPAVRGGSDYCVIAAGTITVNTMVRATGPKPLVLIASESILIDNDGVIDVGSYRRPGEEMGAGTDLDPVVCMQDMSRLPPDADQGGGGAGGSFIESGGSGGSGAGSQSGSGGEPDAPVTSVAAIRGGCAGQPGAGAPPGLRGYGGGAVFLIAGNDINVHGAILAGGEGGGGGITDVGMTKHSGGGGGGAGGMIGLDAPLVSVTGRLFANGGGGGEGAGSANSSGNGRPGDDARTTCPATMPCPACGGNGNTKDGGAGGCGSPGCKDQEGSCNPPNPPDPPTSNGTDGGSNSGGGGGGGGAGVILIHAPVSKRLEGQVSPPPTP